jgi:hypothetical protein
MRTTLTLDDDVTALVARELKRRKTSLKTVVNEALRKGLAESGGPGGPRKTFRTRSVSLGAPRIDIDNVWDAIAYAEGESYR